jgi:hypothetical protein
MSHRLSLGLGLLAVMAAGAGCQTAHPGVGNAASQAAVGTLTGSVHATGNAGPLSGRGVTATEVASGEHYSGITNRAGGFIFALPPGRYRLAVDLMPGEMLLQGSGEVRLALGQTAGNQKELVVGNDPR